MFRKIIPPVAIIILIAINCSGQSPNGNSGASAPAKAAVTAGKAAIVLPPEKSQPVNLPRFEKPPVIDGKLDDEVWQHATVLKDFYQVQPGDNIPPSKQTEVFLGMDSK